MKKFKVILLALALVLALAIATSSFADGIQILRGNSAPEGTAVKSTGEAGGTKFLREDGDGTCSWQAAGGNSEASTAAGQLLFGDGTGEWDHSEVTELFWDDTGKNLGVGTSDFDGTPAVGKLTVKGTTNDGSTNILVGRDSDEANVFSVDTDGNFATDGEITGKLDVNVDTTATYDIPAQSHYGGVAVNGDADAIEMDLDAALVGMSIMLIDGYGGAITVDPNGTETITYEGVTGAAGEAFISSGTKGDMLALICVVAGEWIVTGHDGNGWSEETP